MPPIDHRGRTALVNVFSTFCFYVLPRISPYLYALCFVYLVHFFLAWVRTASVGVVFLGFRFSISLSFSRPVLSVSFTH